MTKDKSNNIKKIYSDSLYWAMSPKSKGKPYHLTRVDETILRKLIHYDKTNKQIRYSSEWIAKHTFLDVTQIEKTIPRLDKIGYIKTVTHTSKDDSGNKIKRRTININWVFIEKVLNDIPKNELELNEADESKKSMAIINSDEHVVNKEPKKFKSIVENLEYILANDEHKPPPLSHFEIKFGLDEKVNIFDIIEYAEFGFRDALDFIEYFDAEEVIFGDLIEYIIELRNEQNCEDYDSLEITDVYLKNIIQIIRIEESENNSSKKSKEVVETLKYILANDEHKPAPYVLPDYKININEYITLLDVIEDIGFDIQDSSYFTDYFDDEDEVIFGDLIKYIIETRNEQNIEGYTSLEVTDLVLKNLIHMTCEEPVQLPIKNQMDDAEESVANELTKVNSSENDSTESPLRQYLNNEIIDIREIMTILEFNEHDINKFLERFDSCKVSFDKFRYKIMGEHLSRKYPDLRTIEVSNEQLEKCMQMGKEEIVFD